jgi:hypothetical protein
MTHPHHDFAYVTCEYRRQECTGTWKTAGDELHVFHEGRVERVPLRDSSPAVLATVVFHDLIARLHGSDQSDAAE